MKLKMRHGAYKGKRQFKIFKVYYKRKWLTIACFGHIWRWCLYEE